MIPGLNGIRSSGSFGRFTRAFHHRNFSVYVAGSSVSLIGMWMQRIAVGWVTWELTESGTWLGIIAFADLFPTVLISPIAGVVADREDRLWLAKITQTLAMLQATALAVLALAGCLNIWLLLGLTVFQGVVISFWQPARLSLIPNLVPPEDLPSAVAINSVIFNTARFVGPAVAGVFIVYGGAGWAFVGNAVSYLALLLALLSIQLSETRARKRNGRFGEDIMDGYRYAARHPGIGPIIVLMTASSVFMRPVAELLPGFADAVFRHGAQGLSALAAAIGIGAVGGGVWLGQRSGLHGLTRLAVLNVALLVGCLLVFTMTDIFWLGVICLLIAGINMVIAGAGSQTLLQTAVDSAMRGRVMALHGMIFRGGPAVGALAMGALSETLGLQLPLALGCLLALAVWIWTWRRLPAMVPALEASRPHQ